MIVCPWKDIGRYVPVIPGLEEAVQAINSLTSLEPAAYPLSGGCKFMVQQGTTKSNVGRELEAHRQFLDIHYILEGEEAVGWAPIADLPLSGGCDEGNDYGMYAGECAYMNIKAGYCYVVFPEDAHMPSAHLDTPKDFRKIVVKLKV